MIVLEAVIQVYNDNDNNNHWLYYNIIYYTIIIIIIIIINVSFVSDFEAHGLNYNVTCRTGDQGVKNNAGD